MKVLMVCQGGPLESMLAADLITVAPGRNVYVDNGETATCPRSASARGTVWQPAKHSYQKSFDEYCEQFPVAAIELQKIGSPPYGSAYYIKAEDGAPQLLCSNFDTSG